MNLHRIPRPLLLVVSAVLLGSCAGTHDTTGPGATVVYAVVSGDAQSGPAGLPLPQPLVVSARTDAGQPVAGKPVTFAVTAGGGQLSASQALTDAAGNASVTWTLGTTAGAVQTVEARQGSGGTTLIGSFSATALTGAPAALAIAQGDNQSAVTTLAVPTAPGVRLTDRFNNPIPGATVTFAVGSGGGAITAGSATTDANGLAAVGSWTLGDSAVANTLTATVSGTGITGNPATFHATALRPVLTLATAASSSAQSGAPFAQQPVIQLQDGSGHNVAIAGRTVTAAIASGNGSLLGTVSVTTDNTGKASFTDLALSGPVGSFTLGYSAPGAVSVSGTAITLSAGPAASISAYQGNNQTAVTGLAVAVAPAVKLTDGQGNPISGGSVTFAVAGGGGSITGASAVSDAQGIARVGSWTLGSSAGGNTLTATAAGSGVAGNPVTFTATAVQPVLVLSTAPSDTAQSGVAFARQPVIQVQDGSGNNAPLSGKTVTATIATGTGSLVGTAAATTNASGQATFSSLGISGTAGTFTLEFVLTGGTPVASGSITLISGPADTISVYEGDNQTAVAGQPVAIAPAVRLTDAQGNLAIGDTVTFAVASGGGSLTGATAVSDAQGIARAGSWTLGPSAGANTLTATVTGSGVSGNPVTFTATAVQPVLVLSTAPSDTAQSGVALTRQPVIQVQDGSGNNVPLSGKTVTATIATGTGSLVGATATTNGSGQAAFSGLAISGTVGTFTLTFSLPGATPVTSGPVTLTAGSPSAMTLNTGDGQSANAGTTLPVAPSVKVTDASGNPVYGVPVDFAVTAGGGSVTGASTATDSSGVATVGSWTLGPQSGTNTLTATSTAPQLSGVQVNINATALGDFWTSLTPETVGVRFPASGVYNGKLYAAGGVDTNLTVRNLLQVYDPQINGWTSKAAMPTGRSGASGGWINSKFYVVAGALSGGSATNALEVYDPGTNTWTTSGLAPIPVARGFAASAVLSGQLYVIGGGNPGGQLADVYAYDPGTNTWSAKDSLPAARNDAVGVAYNGKIYVIGGIAGSSIDGAVLIYDPVSNSWSSGSPMPTPRYHVNAEVVNGKIYAAGGLTTSGTTTSTLEVYDPATDSWTPGASMNLGRNGGAVGVVNGLLYVAGGTRSGAIVSATSVYVP